MSRVLVRVDQVLTKHYGVAPKESTSFTAERIGALRHNFHEHPLMQLKELEKLAQGLAPAGQCRFIAPGTRQDSPFRHKPVHPEGRQIGEIFRRIEEPGSWIALYNVETNPAYRDFIKDVVNCMRPQVEREQGPIFLETGFIFVSAPPSVTPFHIDRENNFWLQLKGRKTLNVWEPSDRAVVASPLVDDFILYGSNVTFQEGYKERSLEFDVGPGEGVYFPSTSPHMTRTDDSWARPGDAVSVSMGVNFYTRRTRRRAYVHAANMMLRKLGINPRHPGGSQGLDGLKYPLGRAVVWARRMFRGYQPSSSF